MFSNFLVPLSGDGLSDDTMKRIAGLAKRDEAAITLVHVSTPFAPYIYADVAFPNVISEELHKKNCKKFSKILFANATKQLGPELNIRTHHVFNPNVFQGIIDVAKKSKADVILMPSHRRSGLKRLFLGSETQAVVVHSKLPVLVL